MSCARSGDLLRFDALGIPTTVGTGFVAVEDLVFGPDGALYVSENSNNRVLHISGCGLSDTDGDGLGDACDPCTNVGGARNITVKPKVVVNKINADVDPTNDGLTIAGEFINATNFALLDPLMNGARVLLQNQAGGTEADVTLASGALGGKGTRGWKKNRKGTKWTFQDKTGTPANGITKMIIQDRSSKAPNRVKVMVRGKKGTYPIVSGDEPVKATVVLGDQAASVAGQCGETVLLPANCSFNRRMNKLTCKP